MGNKHALQLGVFSQYRTQIMGIAAIMILICHIVGNGVALPHSLSKIFSLGNYGVDIFMFVSGLGMFYSIDNNNMPLGSWYRKRFVRIFVPYLLISVPYCLIITIFYDFTFTDIILNITTAEFWVLHRGAWFVSAILPLYMVTPVLHRKNSSNKERLIVALAISALMIVLSRISISNNALIHNVQFVLGRMPMFIIGYYIAANIRNKDCMQFKHVLAIFIVSLFLYTVFNVYTSLTIPLLILFGYIIQYICKLNIIDKCLLFMGKISLESYLTNIYLGVIFSSINLGVLDNGNYIKYTLVLIIGIPLAYIINNISNKIINTKK